MQDLEYEINILKKLVAINTDSVKKSGYEECAKIIHDEAEKIGLKVEIYDARNKTVDNLPRPSVVATLDVGSSRTLLGIAHYDIVPPGDEWTYSPFSLTVVGNRAYGRGAADDKSAIVALLGAARKVKEKAKMNLKILITPDEEVGGKLGLGYLMEDIGVKGDEALIMDAGTNLLSIGCSGIISGTITVKGIQGHAGHPHSALNALSGIAKLIITLEKFQAFREQKLSKMDSPPDSPKKKLWGRFSVTMLKSGEKSNIIPGVAEATFDMRLLPEEDSSVAEKELRDFLAKVDLGDPRYKVELNITLTAGSYYIDPHHQFVQRFKKAIEKATGKEIPLAAELGGNDGQYTSAKGIPTISYGTIRDDTHFHGSNEFVWLEDLKMGRDVVVHYLTMQ